MNICWLTSGALTVLKLSGLKIKKFKIKQTFVANRRINVCLFFCNLLKYLYWEFYMTDREIAINELRVLGAMEIANAKSGHTGIVLSSAPILFALFNDHLNFNPKDEKWLMRDRFILSAGHGSALLYATLHLFGYDYSVDDLKSFRQLNSKCAGHPDYGASGVEVTTGPLGQGIANAVGMALCEKKLNNLSKKISDGFFEHYTYVLVGEGDLSEGISYEACSLAGLWKLNKLIVLLDSNNMTIEGKAELALGDDLRKRFEAQGFFVVEVEDGNDSVAISEAITRAKEQGEKPSFIICRTKLGYGCELEDNPKIHGSALSEGGLNYLRDKLGVDIRDWKFSKSTKAVVAESAKRRKQVYNDSLKKLRNFMTNEIFAPVNADAVCKKLFNENWFYDMSTRASCGKVLNFLKDDIPNLLGGSADLAPSTKAYFVDEPYFSAEEDGRNIHFGIREHAMGAICNGIQLYGVFKSFCSTFFVFSDYLKPSLRMSAIMGLNVLYIFTHDSIAVGEDGVTHQPIEQLAGIRAIPNTIVFRPCDTRETVSAFATYLKNTDKPMVMVLSRQDIKCQSSDVELAMKGGYVLVKEPLERLDVTLVASGSEVAVCTELRDMLFKKGYSARVVSMPCVGIFNEQTSKYKKQVLPSGAVKVFVELSNDDVYNQFMGECDEVFNLGAFGASGKAEDVIDKMQMSAQKLCPKIIKAIKAHKRANASLIDM